MDTKNQSIMSIITTKDLNLDKYVYTDTLKPIHRYNIFSRIYHRNQLNMVNLCGNIFAGVQSLKDKQLTKLQTDTININLKQLIDKFEHSAKGKQAIEIIKSARIMANNPQQMPRFQKMETPPPVESPKTEPTPPVSNALPPIEHLSAEDLQKAIDERFDKERSQIALKMEEIFPEHSGKL